MCTSEEWRPIAGEPHYEVSSLGRVRSATRQVWNYTKRGKILKPSPRRTGGRVTWYAVNLGRGRMRRIHRLVLEAFVGPCPEGMMGCHRDGDPANNALTNLRWDTAQGNQDDSVRHGTKVMPPVARGAAHGNSVLTEAQVTLIRAQPLRRGLYSELGRQLGVSHQTIRQAWQGRTWTHV